MKIRSILCPTDFSEFSRRAVEHAVALARSHGAELTVVHVYPYMLVMSADAPYMPSGLPLDETTRARLLADVAAAAEPARVAGLKPQLLLLEGDPAEEISRLARRAASDLIVMGSHGRRGFDRWILGSVTRRVAQTASCAVLAVPRPPEEAPRSAAVGYERVLCPVDLGTSEETIAAAFEIARVSRAHLTFLYVLEGLPQLEASVRMAGLAWPEFRERLEQSSRQTLRETVAGQGKDGVAFEERVTSGKPYRQILELAEAQRASLIVMGIHGTNPIERMFFGSTALHVLQQAHCPVLTVRPLVERAKP